jgi:hypothetical protein
MRKIIFSIPPSVGSIAGRMQSGLAIRLAIDPACVAAVLI